jgi:hypothetical protein
MVGDAAYLRLSSVVTVFRIKGHASIAEDELNEFTEAGLGANVIRQDDDATPTCLDTGGHDGKTQSSVKSLTEKKAPRSSLS